MRALVSGVLCALFLAGCAESAAPHDVAAPAEAPKAAGPSEARTWDVVLQGRQFVNATVTIHVGDTVRWTHLDGAIGHSVMADDMAFSSNDACMNELLPHPLCMNNGDTFVQRFTAAGTVTYHCHAHHDTMKGSIVVLAA